jgi:thioredoxin-dependent peroxiredoxin
MTAKAATKKGRSKKTMLKVGDKAADFRLPAADGQEVTLSALRGKPVVLYFFPKALTSGWINEASEFRDAKPQFDKLGAIILGCSGDAVETQAKFAAKYNLNFTLLSDPEFKAIEPYGARRMKQFLGKSFLGIVRSTFLIGPDGRIAKIWDKAPSKGHAAEVLEAVKQIGAAQR